MKIYNVDTAKKATNLSLNGDLLEKAKQLDINLSKELETTLIKVIKKKMQENWLRENEKAISEYNESIKKRGLFSDEWRRF